ncbi:MAG: DUF6069 family protein [Actinomycetota bacterium]
MNLIRTAAVGTVAAIVAALIVYFIADAASGPLLVTPAGADEAQELPLGAVIASTIFGGIVGTLVALVARRLSRPRTLFLSVCIVGLLLSFITPFTGSEETSTAIWLVIMHIAVAIPIVGSLARFLPEQKA